MIFWCQLSEIFAPVRSVCSSARFWSWPWRSCPSAGSGQPPRDHSCPSAFFAPYSPCSLNSGSGILCSAAPGKNWQQTSTLLAVDCFPVGLVADVLAGDCSAVAESKVQRLILRFNLANALGTSITSIFTGNGIAAPVRSGSCPNHLFARQRQHALSIVLRPHLDAGQIIASVR
jgi:hypothetical protein